MGNRVYTDPKPQQTLNSGALNVGGKLYFYEPGASSTTLKAIYSDPELTIQYSNPITLDSQGRFPLIFLQDSDYAVRLTDSSDVQIWRVNNYQPPMLENQFDDWDASLTYAVNDYVRYTDGNYYVSLQSANKGRVPPTSTTFWSQGFFLTVWNPTVTYAVDSLVEYQGNFYTSITSNTNQQPDTNLDDWRKPGTSIPAISGYTGRIITYTPNITTSLFDVTLNIPVVTSQSIGPTGSGADNIWTSLDVVPANAVSVDLLISSQGSKTSGVDGFFESALTLSSNASSQTVLRTQGYGGSTSPSHASNGVVYTIILGPNRTFNAIYTSTGGLDTLDIEFFLRGFSVQET